MTMNAAQFAAAAAALGLLSACDDSIVGQLGGSSTEPGAIVERNYNAGAFTKIDLGAPANVEVRADGAPSIHASGGQNFLDQTEVVVEDGTLKIRTKGKNIRWHWDDDKAQPRFVITGASAISAANLGGSGSIRIDRSSAKTFDGNVGGSGDLSVGGLAVERADFAIGGSGNVTAQGTATKTKYAIGGSGDIDATGLSATDAEIAVAGSGNVAARASGTADISLVGSGDVDISGGAKCKTTKMGSGDVKCG